VMNERIKGRSKIFDVKHVLIIWREDSI
jgi:hypothetical protein